MGVKIGKNRWFFLLKPKKEPKNGRPQHTIIKIHATDWNKAINTLPALGIRHSGGVKY
jgi:hypothetical protein